jgi:hypothetical protein
VVICGKTLFDLIKSCEAPLRVTRVYVCVCGDCDSKREQYECFVRHMAAMASVQYVK